MTKYDVFYLLILAMVTSSFICLSCYPRIEINAKKKELELKQIGKEKIVDNKGFTLNLNLFINKKEESNQSVNLSSKEETKATFGKPNFR